MSQVEPDSWNDPRGAEIYADVSRRGVLYPTLARRLAELLAPSPGGCWLDLAAGTGLGVEMLLARVGRAGQVVAVDGSEAMLRVASLAAPVAEAAFVAADPAALPLRGGSLAGAMCSAAFWHFPAPARVFAELARVFAPGAGFAFNIPAGQLADVADLPPAPLQVALAREGERRFHRPPAPAGPVLRRGDLVALAEGAGFALRTERQVDIAVTQQEMADLLAVPAIGARLYPEASPAERGALVAGAAARVDLQETTPVRWMEFLVATALS